VKFNDQDESYGDEESHAAAAINQSCETCCFPDDCQECQVACVDCKAEDCKEDDDWDSELHRIEND